MDTNAYSIKNSFVLMGLVAFIAISTLLYRSLANNVDLQSVTDISQSPFARPSHVVSGEYKNGSYSATGKYIASGGPASIKVTLALKGDIVENIDVVTISDNPTSEFFQDKFKAGYKNLVIGKNIKDVQLDKVSGSSLTPIGFNDAIEQIKAQAKS